MKKSNLIKLGDAIQEFLKEYALDDKLMQYSIKNHWDELVGKRIAKHTAQIYFTKEGNLVIEFTSDAARHEASYLKTEIREKLNRYAGKELIKEVILR
ncbi:MAG: DUF721 domain-containing protein [Bacteroidia bacterium]|nr:DUF721 domain-containing protein [Bacteroidia bacterium]